MLSSWKMYQNLENTSLTLAINCIYGNFRANLVEFRVENGHFLVETQCPNCSPPTVYTISTLHLLTLRGLPTLRVRTRVWDLQLGFGISVPDYPSSRTVSGVTTAYKIYGIPTSLCPREGQFSYSF